MLSEAQLQTLQKALQVEAQRLQNELREIGTGDGSELQFDANFADTSQVTAERGELDALSSNLVEALEDVNAALARIDAGTYGICEVCGNEISYDRLEARPEAVLCMNDASR
jgi:DnaK suppressor protein